LLGSKKGEMTLLMTIELIVVISIAFIVFEVSTAYAKSDTVIKVNSADNLGMMVETVVAIPGDIVVQYPKDLSKFNVLVDANRVLVMLKDDPITKRAQTNFNVPSGYVVRGIVKNKKFICIDKKNKEVLIRACKDNEIYK